LYLLKNTSETLIDTIFHNSLEDMMHGNGQTTIDDSDY